MDYRIEHDTMGEVAVPATHHWGAQTQRSLENFPIGGQRQPREIIEAFAYLKDACAQANAAASFMPSVTRLARTSSAPRNRPGKQDTLFT